MGNVSKQDTERVGFWRTFAQRKNVDAKVKGLWFFTSAFVVKIVVFVWIGSFGFPRTDGDNIFFHQPAYMHFFNGHFSIPTLEGRLPHVQETFGAYPPGYTLLAVVVFNVFGFTMPSMLWMDIVIHLLVSTLFSLTLLHLLQSGYTAGLLLLSSSYLINPRGRPDELGVLLVLLAMVYFVWRDKPIGAGIALGFAHVVQPVQGLVGVAISAFIHYQSSRSLRKTMQFLLIVIALSGAVAAAIWFLTIYPKVSQSVEQFVAHMKFRYAPKPLRMLNLIPTWGIAFLASVTVSTIGAVVLLLKKEVKQHMTPLQYLAIKMLAYCLPVVGLIQLAGSSPHYSYRFLSYSFLAGCFIVVPTLFRLVRFAQWMWTATVTMVAVGMFCVLLVANHEIIRYALLPFTWKETNVRWQDARETVARLVPPDGMVGGDPIMWWTISDGRPYYSLGWYTGNKMPDYVLSGTFWAAGGETDVMMRPGWSSRLRESYEEISPVYDEAKPARLSLGHIVIPISRSSAADWRVRIWKKKSNQQ